ncbi:hypothetical protein AAMO2058_000759400 [Amorphochlora amoebiformis]
MANRGSLSLPLPPPPPCSPAEKIEKKANSRENEKNIGNVRISPLRSRRRSNSTFQLKKKIPERILEFSANAKPPPPPPRLTERGKKMYGGREKKRKGKVDFDTVLDNLALRELFYAHLKLEKSEENLHFYDAVKRLELKYGDITQDVSTGMVAARTLRKAQKEAKRIYQRFLQENSAEAVNISFRVRKRIHKYFRAMMMVFHPNFSSPLSFPLLLHNSLNPSLSLSLFLSVFIFISSPLSLSLSLFLSLSVGCIC